MDLQMNCGKSVIAECEGLRIPYNDAGFQRLVGEGVAAANGVINVMLSVLANTFTENKIKALNSVRCAILNGGYSIWYFIASAWWGLYFLNLQHLVEDMLDKLYPHICTCKGDVDSFAEMFGASE